jgi:hypothetical protein
MKKVIVKNMKIKICFMGPKGMLDWLTTGCNLTSTSGSEAILQEN